MLDRDRLNHLNNCHVPGYVTVMATHEEEPETLAAETPSPSSSERKAVVSERWNLRPLWLTASFDRPIWPTGPTRGGWCWLKSSHSIRKWTRSWVCGVFWQIKALKKTNKRRTSSLFVLINVSIKVIQVRCCIVGNWTLVQPAFMWVTRTRWARVWSPEIKPTEPSLLLAKMLMLQQTTA